MLSRYHIQRGRKTENLPTRLRQGRRIDTRKHTSHCLRPSAEMVTRYLSSGSEAAWTKFRRDYRALLDKRFSTDRDPFDQLHELARSEDVFIGCSCPSAKNPDVRRCHTVLALGFMQKRYPDLDVEFPVEVEEPA